MNLHFASVDFFGSNVLNFMLRVGAVVERIHPAIYYFILACALFSCFAIRFGPARIRPLCALPFLPTLALTLWFGSQGSPELFSLSAMAGCPLTLWAARAFSEDPMRDELMDIDETHR
jgi:hypothetical protein